MYYSCTTLKKPWNFVVVLVSFLREKYKYIWIGVCECVDVSFYCIFINIIIIISLFYKVVYNNICLHGFYSLFSLSLSVSLCITCSNWGLASLLIVLLHFPTLCSNYWRIVEPVTVLHTRIHINCRHMLQKLIEYIN